MILADAEATEALGRSLAGLLRGGDVVALFGDLGAGKTTLARGILRGLGFGGDVASPTFPLVLPYEGLSPPVWHVDLYRIEEPDEVEALALDEALEDGALLVEWPERLGDRLWRQALRLTLVPRAAGGRALTAGVPAAWEARWPPR
ncbi:MAG: tRNA (adenosine(37)-N6)-threonylcarbamoyltransferase complex ATPase subunit type 1 TsaE [Alphaproteobacteria bacterium]|nr:tRNA (adenosine(37)-N6)-threonylcarbamoyltransferase complex ATPase subunit type 1 TsaE [Alphaproteobacteria bacterium]MBV9371239.1 tRNA (adenosine(37)-N6)-threonylcarbamoyltransferase complex ATPase subunit type 1 TsaE [Alphaproteobacteria bacterium]MBV9902822.1 tRNA (adenosine(37)-N6)-threonylcarbamoyltransferase complex ATPase subunit type 1 TsaE [Alphaproteobacteria bacterium]